MLFSASPIPRVVHRFQGEERGAPRPAPVSVLSQLAAAAGRLRGLAQAPEGPTDPDASAGWLLSTEVKVEHESGMVTQLIAPASPGAAPLVRDASQSRNQVRMQKGLIEPESVAAVR